MDMKQATLTHQRHDQVQILNIERILHAATQWGYHKRIRDTYGREEKIEVGEMIRNKVSLKCNGTIYNGFEKNMYVEISLERQPQKNRQEKKDKMMQLLIQDEQEISRQYFPN